MSKPFHYVPIVLPSDRVLDLPQEVAVWLNMLMDGEHLAIALPTCPQIILVYGAGEEEKFCEDMEDPKNGLPESKEAPLEITMVRFSRNFKLMPPRGSEHAPPARLHELFEVMATTVLLRRQSEMAADAA